jgi:ribosomal protein L11 methyltransferase
MVEETWIEVRLLLPAGMQEEGSIYLTEFSGRGIIRAYFRPEEFTSWAQAELQEYLRRLGAHQLHPLGLEWRRVAEQDWAEAWKAHFKPLKVTSRLVISPPWEVYAGSPEELVIVIYPGMAFGTGRHPTTLLCLRALEEVWGAGVPSGGGPWQVLDVGTGTGILALAAARLGARVLAIDLDPEAVAAALENVRLNALQDRIWVEETPIHALRGKFGLILANITAPDLMQLAEALSARLLPEGVLVISGFLEDDAPGLEARYTPLGMQKEGIRTLEDWVALIFRRP